MNEGGEKAMLRTAAADSPGVTFPPPFIYIGFLLLGIVADHFWPASFGAGAWQPWIGGALIVAGVALMTAGMVTFRRAGTNVPPNRPAVTLVTHGPWRFSRNPLYLSLALVHLGIGIAADNVWMVALLAPVLLIIRYAVIAREERYLDRKFGDAYRRYRSSVRRWF
jgi:protein-S-isoprenylcysteine O-methyltransferase Ste14